MATSSNRYVWSLNPVQPRNNRLDSGVWDEHKEVILRECQRGSLAHVRKYMQDKHNFFAKLHQYKYRIYTIWKTTLTESRQTRSSGRHADHVRDNDSRNDGVPDAECQDLDARTNETSEDQGWRLDETAKSSVIPDFENKDVPATCDRYNYFDQTGSAWGSQAHVDQKALFLSGSVSLNERDPSAASAQLFNDLTHKRPASLSSQGSPASTKRFKYDDTSFAMPSLGRDSYDACFAEAITSAAKPDQKHTRHDTTSATSKGCTLDLSCKTRLRASRRDREVVFQCSSVPSKPNDFEGSAFFAHEISDLPWDDICSLRDAADIFSVFSMSKPAFQLHYNVWKRLELGKECPCGRCHQLSFRELQACARVAETPLELQTARMTLESYVNDALDIYGENNRPIIHMLLADICTKQGDLVAAGTHRGIAFEQLPKLDRVSHLSEICDIMSKDRLKLDFNADYQILRAYAFGLLRMNRHILNEDHKRKEGLLEEVRMIIKQIWMVLARKHHKDLLNAMFWCRNQLLSASGAEFEHLWSSLDFISPSIWSSERLKIMVLFLFFLERRYGKSFDCGIARSFKSSVTTSSLDSCVPVCLDNNKTASVAWLFWILSTITIKAMRADKGLSSRLENVREVVSDLTNKFLELAAETPESLSDRIFFALPSQDLAMTQNPKFSKPKQHDIFNSDLAIDLVKSTVRRMLGIVVAETSNASGATRKPFTEMSNCATTNRVLPAIRTSMDLVTDNQTTSICPNCDNAFLADPTLLAPSECSSVPSSMQRIASQNETRTSPSSRCGTPVTPTKWIQMTCEALGRPPPDDWMTDSLLPIDISDKLQSSLSSSHLKLEDSTRLNSSNQPAALLSLTTLCEINALVVRIFAAHGVN
ncbi:uncharacterized protein PV09_07010 [Verruconis gallopava]|uniref:Clr5 domain-containing protein n=1 Tax=Verruconis gallopava TaxID=253628 RepID=A0A0D1YL61_9PEZI|nr:uncharacterized protein PV09_07010 [Verruconis gallopava]KIW01532.1 hypothetical protein PV09_07010 [Verruconis gallopava]